MKSTVEMAVTLDAEADNQWDYGIPITTRNVEYWSEFQNLCERYGVRPTYLASSEIVLDERARALLADYHRRGAAEVGAHLHPWTTPPFLERPGLRYNDPAHAYPSQLPHDLLAEKLAVLTNQIVEGFGITPTAYRAGRFGIDVRGAKALANLGYLADSSVTPLVSWQSQRGLDSGGPDFRSSNPHPFRISGTGEPGLIELPVTVLSTYAAFRRAPFLLAAYQTLPVRAARKLLLSRWASPQPMWLTPDPRYSADDLIRVWRCAAEMGRTRMVMMLHTSELMPGGSPFRPDAASLRHLYVCLEQLFRYAVEQETRFVTLSEMARSADQLSRLDVLPL